MMRIARRLVGVMLFAIAGPATLAAGPASLPAVMAQLRPGLWEVRVTDDPAATPQRLCVADLGLLVQLRHRAVACSRLVIEDKPRAATINYSCPAGGWGRTTVSAKGADAVRIESQGIAGNAPFAFTAEARRVGGCASRPPVSR